MIDDFIKELFKKPMIPVFVDVRDGRFTRSKFATKVIDIARYCKYPIFRTGLDSTSQV